MQIEKNNTIFGTYPTTPNATNINKPFDTNPSIHEDTIKPGEANKINHVAGNCIAPYATHQITPGNSKRHTQLNRHTDTHIIA